MQPDTVSAGAGADTVVNNNFRALSPSGLYGIRPAGTAGLVLGYFGGEFNGVTVANGTVTLTASNTNYVVANRTTGVVSAAITTTNWLDTATYMQLYQLVAGSASFTIAATSDKRQAFGWAGVAGFTGGTLTSALNEAPTVTIASAATVNIGAAAANSIIVTGTTTITAFDSIAASAKRMVIFSGVLTLTHNATSLILPTGASITTAAGDVAEFISLGSGNWRCVGYMRANGTSLSGSAFTGGTLTSALNEAPQVTLASAATVNIGAAAANTVTVSGTTTITAFDSIATGAIRRVRFLGALTLTHNATTLILPGSANIATAAGDVATMESLGSGNWRCVGYAKADGTSVVGGGGGGLTYITESLNTASPNNTINAVALTVTGGTTNADLVLVPKGSGSIQVNIADSTSTGGNKRGTNAVDLQRTRSAATQVASSSDSVISGGSGNTASGSNSIVAGGSLCQATAAYAYAAGNGNVAGGISSWAGGGQSNTASASFSFAQGQSCAASGTYSIATGNGASTRSVIGMRAHSNGSTLGVGTIQSINMPLRVITASTSATSLTADGAAKSATNHYVLNNRCTAAVNGLVSARNQTGDVATWSFSGGITREANAASTVVTAAITPVSLGSVGAGSGWTLAVVADTTNGSLDIQFTGASGIVVSAYLESAEVTRA